MPSWLESCLMVLIALTMCAGQVGLVIPVFPGNVVIWMAALAYGIIFGFGNSGIVGFLLITVLMLIAVSADNLLMGAKARAEGAAWGSILTALASGVLFTLLFPPVGGLIAAPAVLFGMEYRRHGDRGRAQGTVRALIWGLGLAFAVRFILGSVMILLWLGWVFSG